MARWLLYGANGFTGKLIAQEALQRGHQPLLAGRSAEKLAPLAQSLGLDYAVFALDDQTSIEQALRDVDLVFHAAGPFVHTSDPMLRACMSTSTHYLDITGEYPVFENTFRYDEDARRLNVTFISGVGFDVVPSDCLARYVAAQLPNAQHLEIAIIGLTQMSAGTTKSGLALIKAGGLVRRDGILKPYPIGTGGQRIQFSGGEYFTMPIPWGDLAAAYRSTGIPNITTYMAVPRAAAYAAQVFAPLLRPLLANISVHSFFSSLIDRMMRGPDEALQQSGRAYLWARAVDVQGNSAEAWLETIEPYRFTALAGVAAVERILSAQTIGALTPAQAFGADFVLDIEGTKRFDRL